MSELEAPELVAAAPARQDALTKAVGQYLSAVAGLTEALPAASIVELVALLRATHERGGTVFLCGNGGSAATASHLASDLGRPARSSQAGIRAVCLNDNVAALTAWANDAGFAEVFSGPLRRLARPGDVLLAISASGRSPNVVTAALAARCLGMNVVAFTGFDGGELRKLADLLVHVPSDEHGVVEAVHAGVLHALGYALRKAVEDECKGIQRGNLAGRRGAG